MSGKSDLRHATNVTNFEIFVDSCKAIGPALYKPTRLNLKLESLLPTLERAKACLADFDQGHVGLKKAMEAQDVVFGDFEAKIGRIKDALPAVDEHGSSLLRKLQGAHAEATVKTDAPKAAKPAAAPEANLHHTVAHTTLKPVVDNTKALLQVVRSTPGYAPQDQDLAIEALETWLASLVAAVDAVAKANATQDHARDVRQEVLYMPHSGIVDLAIDGKSYVKSLKGAPDAEARKISKLDFH